jgi:hypothetical protein
MDLKNAPFFHYLVLDSTIISLHIKDNLANI